MPRYARLHAPGALVHVIARFVNREFRLRGDDERAFYLHALGRVLGRVDWTLLAYALMSSHVHLALEAGEAPPWELLKPLHVAVARDLNRRHGAFGPVFAERATTIVMPIERVGALAPYIHNNPVRAGLVSDAEESTWTSHRAWVGLADAPPWLAVERGLCLAGFGLDAAGRMAFHAGVRARRQEPRDTRDAPAEMARDRANVRAATGLPVEVSSSFADSRGDRGLHVLGVRPAPRTPWAGDFHTVVAAVAQHSGLAVEAILSRSRRAEVVAARRVAALVAIRFLGRSRREVAVRLGVSAPALTGLLKDEARVAALLGDAASVARALEPPQPRRG